MNNDKFIWKDEYSVGVRLIDEQHQMFFKIANSVIDFAGQPMVLQKRDELLNLLNDLENYALYHLDTEEEYFNQFHYEATEHIVAHDQYRSVMKRMFNEARRESSDITDLTKEAAAYAGNWLVKHIIIMDKEYTKVFNEHGIK